MKSPRRKTSLLRVFPLFVGIVLGFGISVPVLHAQDSDEMNKFRLAQSYEQGGRYEDALRFFSDLQTWYPANGAYFDGVRRCLVQLKRYREADSLVSVRMVQQPKDPSLWIARGAIRFRAGRDQDAEADWNTAMSLAPRNPGVYTSIADEALSLRSYERAVAALRRGRTALENDRIFTFELARALMMEMKFRDAMSEYLRYLAEVPSALGQIQQQIASFSDLAEARVAALEAARDAASSRGAPVEVRHLLVWLLMEARDYDGALAEARNLDRIRKAGGNELYVYAQRAREDRAWVPALLAFRELLDQYPRAGFSADATFQYIRCIEELARDSGEAKDAKATRDRERTGVELSLRTAADLYRTALTTFPTHPAGVESGYRLALILAYDQRQPDDALRVLTPLLDLRRRLTTTIDADLTAADLLLMKDDLEGARTRYQTLASSAVGGREGQTQAAYRAAEILWFQGKFDEAVSSLEPLTRETRSDVANDALSLMALISQNRQGTESSLKELAVAGLRLRQGRAGEADAVLRGILATQPAVGFIDRVLLERGAVLTRLGLTDSARAMYEDLILHHSDSIYRDDALHHLALLWEGVLHEPSRALGLYQQMLEEYPHSLFVPHARERIQSLRKGSS